MKVRRSLEFNHLTYLPFSLAIAWQLFLHHLASSHLQQLVQHSTHPLQHAYLLHLPTRASSTTLLNAAISRASLIAWPCTKLQPLLDHTLPLLPTTSTAAVEDHHRTTSATRQKHSITDHTSFADVAGTLAIAEAVRSCPGYRQRSAFPLKSLGRSSHTRVR